MYSQVQAVLERYGYENITLNARGIYVALRQMQEKSCVVVTLDETAGDRLGTEQFYHISEQIREHLMGRGCTHCIFLYLLISDDDSSAGRIFKNYECFWRISPKRGQLMVFEREEEAFMVLRRPLEELLVQGESFKKIERKQLPLCNIVIILINVLVFLYTDFFAVFGGEGVLDAGALGWYAVLEEGQWYRMFSSMFLHLGGDHLFNNMLVLAYIGSMVELELGSFRYGILYIVSGLLAGGTSMVYNMMQNTYTVSVGASGAIFGTIGAILFLVLFYKRKRIQYSMRQIAFLAFFSLYGGFASQGVDNAAHFGGFIAGFLCAGLLTMRWGQGAEKDS